MTGPTPQDGALLGPVWRWLSEAFRDLNDRHGINIPIFYDAYDGLQYLEAVIMTVQLAVLALLSSLAIGFVAGAYRYRAGWLGGRLVDIYVAVFRNTPVLAQLYFFYFGLGAVISQSGAIPPNYQAYFGGFFWSVVALGFHFGAYNIEIVRAGLESVPKSTIDAAKALGYTPAQTLRTVILPIGLRIALPSLTNSLVQIVKTTAIAYAVAVPEVLYVADRIWTSNFNVTEMMNVVLLTYLALIGLMILVTSRIDRALRLPGTQI